MKQRIVIGPYVVAVLTTLMAASVADAQSSKRLDEAQALVKQGSQATKPSAATRWLRDAERLLKDELRANPSCQRCEELLTADFFFRAQLKLDKDFGDVVERAATGLARFPASGTLALFKGYAHYNKSEFGDAARALNRYVASLAAASPDLEPARRMLTDSRQRFQTSWYNQANFYQSPESRMERVNTQTFAKETLFQVTKEYELGLGEQAFMALRGTATPMQDALIENYLQQIVTRLTTATPGPDFPYHVSLFSSLDANAVTTPGHVVVYSGLLQLVDSEAELAAVLAHELAHSYGHHAARRLIKGAQAQQLAGAVAAAINPQGPLAQIITSLAAAAGVALFQSAYSRFEESEADRYAAHILYNAGYNPTALAATFLNSYRRQPNQPIKFFSTHPPAPDRADAITDYLEAFALDQELALDSETFRTTVGKRFPRPVPASLASAPSVPRGPATRVASSAQPSAAARGVTNGLMPSGSTRPAFPQATVLAPAPIQAASVCTIGGAWTQQAQSLGSSTWRIEADGRAKESGLLNTSGQATLTGRTLRIHWGDSGSGVSGYYEWQLDATCRAGSGRLVFAGIADTRTSTVKRIN